MVGTADGLLDDPRGDVRWGVDFKSINDAGFLKLSTPSKHYRMQFMCYMMSLDIHNFLVIYINKNTSQLRAIPIYREQKLIDEIQDRVDFIRKCVDTGQIPHPVTSTYECRFCPFQQVCKDTL